MAYAHSLMHNFSYTSYVVLDEGDKPAVRMVWKSARSATVTLMTCYSVRNKNNNLNHTFLTIQKTPG